MRDVTDYRCSKCHRKVKVRVPKGGDGSEVRPYRHDKSPYSSWHYSGQCDGHLEAAVKGGDDA